MAEHSALLPHILDAIGDTPLVELSRIARELEGRLFAKLEYLNPGFSKRTASRGKSLRMRNATDGCDRARQ